MKLHTKSDSKKNVMMFLSFRRRKVGDEDFWKYNLRDWLEIMGFVIGTLIFVVLCVFALLGVLYSINYF